MRWPWPAKRSDHRLVLRRLGAHHAFVLTDGAPRAGSLPRLLRWGVAAAPQPIAAGEALALLEPDEYQILRVDTPKVPPEELKAAARWQVKDMVNADLAELTLDVMHVGGDVERAQRQLFVIAARNRALQSLTAGAAGLHAQISVVDIWETALRNLVSHQAQADGITGRACAGLLFDDEASLLVVCADDELFYTRRLEADPGLLARARGELQAAPTAELPLGFEYQPGGSFEAAHEESSPLVVELQRSIDVWERSWPELPLARLYLITSDHGNEIATLIQRELGLRTLPLDPLTAFAPHAPAPEGPAAFARAACLPLLGAALRHDARKL